MDDPTITNTINIDDIRYESEQVNMFTNKITPYNANSYYPLHKFWVYFDKAVVLKNIISNKIRTIIVALTSKADCITEIKQIEKQIYSKLENDEFLIGSKIDSKLCDTSAFVPTIELTIDDNSKLFNANNKEIENSKNIEIKDHLELICELDYFLVGNNTCKSYWRVVQLRKIELLNLNVPLFDKVSKKIQQRELVEKQKIKNFVPDKKVEHEETISQPIAIQKPKQQEVSTKPTVGFMIPTPKDLQNALSGLRKVKNNQDCKDDKKEEETSSPTVTALKHVETRETNVIQMLKNEQKMMNDFKKIQKLDEMHKKIKKCKDKLHTDINLN